jgi:hypothetical protein
MRFNSIRCSGEYLNVPRRDGVCGECKELCGEELRDVCCLPDFITIIMLRR